MILHEFLPLENDKYGFCLFGIQLKTFNLKTMEK